ncbi:MAG: 2Fe-2S iron-sulfur cluster-binding protein, partial [Oscillospiraceae bacterium]
RKDIISARSDEPIIVAIERAGIKSETNCRSGECGFCRSELLSGEIFVCPDGDGRRMADKQYGFFHPCSSYPVSDLSVKIPIL